MSKRLTRSDYIISLVVIFLIISTIGAFFYGLKVGKESTEKKFMLQMADKNAEEIPAELTAYHQQYLVSFYHTIFLPYRDFQKNWFNHMDSIELRSNTTDIESVFKELDKLAKQHYNQLLNRTMPETSPLLQKAHEDVLKSLRLFSEAVKQADFKKMQGIELIQEIENDAFFQEAMQYGLSAQTNYYAAIAKWHSSIDADVNDLEVLADESMRIEDWHHLKLNEKNYALAVMMETEKYYEPYYVHDVTLRVDELIMNGQAQKMNLLSIKDIMDALVNTRAIRVGDFISSKDRFYQAEQLPQLPFFYE